MKNLTLNKRDLIFTACSAMIVSPTVSVSAQSIVIKENTENNSDLPKLNLAVEDDTEAFFSPPISQPEELSQQEIIPEKGAGEEENKQEVLINNASDEKSSNIIFEEDKQKKQNSSTPLSLVNEVSIITPQAGVTTADTTNIAIQHHPSAKIQVRINGKPIDKDISSFVHKDEEQKLHTTIWYNVALSWVKTRLRLKLQR